MTLQLRPCPPVLARTLGSLPDGPVLDIGCGSGVILAACDAAGIPLIGIDLSEGAIEICRTAARRSSHGHRFIRADVRDYPIAESAYAAIVAMSSLVAMTREEVLDVLARMKAGVKPGGVIYIEAFTTRDPIHAETDKYLPENATTYVHPQWGSPMYLFAPGELAHRFRDFVVLDYRELSTTDVRPHRHIHHETRLCCRRPATGECPPTREKGVIP